MSCQAEGRKSANVVEFFMFFGIGSMVTLGFCYPDDWILCYLVYLYTSNHHNKNWDYWLGTSSKKFRLGIFRITSCYLLIKSTPVVVWHGFGCIIRWMRHLTKNCNKTIRSWLVHLSPPCLLSLNPPRSSILFFFMKATLLFFFKLLLQKSAIAISKSALVQRWQCKCTVLCVMLLSKSPFYVRRCCYSQ